MGRPSAASGTWGVMLRCSEKQVATLGQSGVLAQTLSRGKWSGLWGRVPGRFLDRDSSTGTKAEGQP